MENSTRLLAFFIFIITQAHAQIFIQTKTVYIHNDSIRVKIYNRSDNGLVYFNMHDDENLCVEEAVNLLENTGGRLIELKHFGALEDKARYVSVKKNNKIYTFDPNRIFTNNDSVRAITLIEHRQFYQAVNQLKKLSASQMPTEAECVLFAKNELKILADTLISLLDTSKAKIIVALHNNHSFEPRCDDNCNFRHGSYNLGTYFRHETEENASADEIYINPKRNLSGFFIVLNHPVFMQAQTHRCNVILQAENAPDDGSFSVFAQHNGLNYINIEAKRDSPDEQRILLRTLSDMLMEWRIEP